MVAGDNNTARPSDRLALVIVAGILIAGMVFAAKACGASYDCKRSGGTVTHAEDDGGNVICIYPSESPSPTAE